MLVQLVLLHNFLHNHMRYIYRQIYNLKGKKFCLNKIRFFLFFFFFTNCSPNKVLHLLTQQIRPLHWVWMRKAFWAVPARSGSFHALRSAWSVHHTSFGVTAEPIP